MKAAAAFMLLILTEPSCCEHVLSLVCPYESRNVSVSQPKVWCKRDAQDDNCCTGFSLQPGVSEPEQGRIHVEDDGRSFTVFVRELTQGDGVYWCGIMTEERVILKLAEDYFTKYKIQHSGGAPFHFIWCILRWVLFFLLTVVSISIHFYSSRRMKTQS